MGDLFQTEKKPITEADRIRLGADLAVVDRALIELKAEKTDVSRAYRVKIRKLEDESDTLSRQLADGVVENTFEVEEVPDDARQVMTILRAETKELLETRRFNEAEKEASRRRRQGELFEGDGDGSVATPTKLRSVPKPTGRPRGRPRKTAKPS